METNYLSALSLFKSFYDNEHEKKSIYRIIANFILITVETQNLVSFSRILIKEKLFETFNFDIPDAVIATALSNSEMFIRDDNTYSLKVDARPKWLSNVNDLIEEQSSGSKKLLSSIKEFIFTKTGENIDDVQLYKSVENVLLKRVDDDNTQLISTFIVMNSNNKSIISALENIKMGYIIYSGLMYSPPRENIQDLISKDITIFLNTEMLFHFYGYNGCVYEEIFNDFLALLKEAKSRKNENQIKLYYFNETKHQIDGYFEKAKAIKRNEVIIDQRQTAMVEICKKCESESDVILEKNRFYQKLKANRIEEFNYIDFFSEDNQKFNLIDEKLKQNIQDELGISLNTQHTYESLKILNYIHILRHGVDVNCFENSGYVLVTDSSITKTLAFWDGIKNQYCFPLATTTEYITNRLWLKLNKGFGNGAAKAIANVVSIAQITLATQVNSKIGMIYDELKSEIEDGKISEEIAHNTILDIKESFLKPEDIQPESIDSVNDFINNKSLKYYKKAAEDKELQIIRLNKANSDLSNAVGTLTESIQQSNKTNSSLETKLLDQNEEITKLKSFVNSYQKIEEEKERKRRRLIRRFKMSAVAIVFIVILIGIILMCAQLIVKNPYIGIIATVVALLLTIIGFATKQISNIFYKLVGDE